MGFFGDRHMKLTWNKHVIRYLILWRLAISSCVEIGLSTTMNSMDLSPGWRLYLPLKFLDQLGTKRLPPCHVLRFAYCIYTHLPETVLSTMVGCTSFECALNILIILKIRFVNSTIQSIAYPNRWLYFDARWCLPLTQFAWSMPSRPCAEQKRVFRVHMCFKFQMFTPWSIGIQDIQGSWSRTTSMCFALDQRVPARVLSSCCLLH